MSAYELRFALHIQAADPASNRYWRPRCERLSRAQGRQFPIDSPVFRPDAETAHYTQPRPDDQRRSPADTGSLVRVLLYDPAKKNPRAGDSGGPAVLSRQPGRRETVNTTDVGNQAPYPLFGP